jgi:hypothetical protein
MKTQACIALFAALLLSACATPGPYAEVVGERQTHSELDEESVRIVGVDGKLDLSGSVSVTLQPGFHMLLVRTTRKGGRRGSQDATLPLNAKACLRYFVVAKHESMSLVDPWNLEIKKTEPIDECLAKFPVGEAPR